MQLPSGRCREAQAPSFAEAWTRCDRLAHAQQRAMPTVAIRSTWRTLRPMSRLIARTLRTARTAVGSRARPGAPVERGAPCGNPIPGLQQHMRLLAWCETAQEWRSGRSQRGFLPGPRAHTRGEKTQSAERFNDNEQAFKNLPGYHTAASHLAAKGRLDHLGARHGKGAVSLLLSRHPQTTRRQPRRSRIEARSVPAGVRIPSLRFERSCDQ